MGTFATQGLEVLMSTTAVNDPPVHRIRYGRITGTIWMNPTECGPMYDLTIHPVLLGRPAELA